MPAVEPNLNQVLRVLDQFDPAELALLEQRLAARKRTAEPSPVPTLVPVADVFDLSFDDYLALSDEAREAVQLRAYETLRSWIDAELEKQGAAWLLVCGGEIVETSPTLRNYPSNEKLMRLGQQRGRVPFVFVRGPLIEESTWSALAGDDFYPTINLLIAAPGTRLAQLPAQGVEITADFDSGSPSLVIDYDQMSARHLIRHQPINQVHSNLHLGQLYRFHVLPLLIGIRSEAGQIAAREFPALCVRDWQQSPLCPVNPNRAALAGRNLLLEFPLCVELDGAAKTTRVALK